MGKSAGIFKKTAKIKQLVRENILFWGFDDSKMKG